MEATLPNNEIIIPCLVEKCKWCPQENGYCKRHQRVYQYNTLVSSGKILCRFFFRGCDNEVKEGIKTCTECLEKKHADKPKCSHEGCENHVKSSKYCGKHIRDLYRDKEIEENIKYCDISRGCFNICDEDYASCKDCLKKSRENEKIVFDKRTKLNLLLKDIISSDKSICVDCGKEYDKFITAHKKQSKRCLKCNEIQKRQDTKRADRHRNYKEECLKSINVHYSNYIKGAFKRDLEFKLSLDQFKNLVKKPCYYCKHYIETEVNGIDRVDNSLSYTEDNCVPCCELCNRMKFTYHPEYFIEKCKIISNKESVSANFVKKWYMYYSNQRNITYTSYKKEAKEKRDLEFKLEESDWESMIKSSCYLCGFTQKSGIGIDRIDNSKREYTIDNCKPCCGSCNLMKGDIQLDKLIDKCKKVSEIWKDISELKKVPYKPNTKRTSKITSSKSTSPKSTFKVKEPRKKWSAKAFYQAIQSNTYKDIIEINKEVLTEEELETEVLAIQQFDTFEKAQEYLKTFLNKLNMRRKRTKL